MPLVHFEVRNEYGLGDPDVYRTAQKDDSRALLEGVAVVGLVGILRQLGDLAEFAAETFRGLHDKVSSTAARSQNMMARIQRLEAGLPSLEKAALSQSSHIHFAYIAGSGWHASVRTEQNHLTRDDLPGFIMDSYDECRGPPRLFLLDKFDAAGAGACLKRYSDPSFFKMERVASELTNSDKVKREKTSKKISRTQRNAEALSTGSLSRHYRRSLTTPHHCGMFYTLDFDEKNQNADDLSFVKYEFKKEPSQTKSSYMECLLDVDETCEPGKVETYALCSSLTNEQCIHVETSMISDDQANSFIEDAFFREPSCCENNPGPLRITWDEKTEAETLATSSCGSVLKVETQSMAHRNAGFSEFRSQEGQFISIADRDHHEIAVDDGKWPKTCAIEIQKSEAVSEPDNYVDARNIMGSEVESDYEGRIKRAPEFQHVHKELGMRSVVDKQETCDISDNCGIETPSTSTSLLNDELAEGFSQANIPDNNNLGTPAVDVFENEVDAVPDIEMRKETVFHSVKDKSADRADFSDRQAAASYIYMSDLNNSAISCSVKQATSTNFWTNGGLLGLQSSKPPDFGATKVPEDGHEVHRFIADAASQCSPANLNGAGSFGKFGGNTETLCEPRSGKEYGKYEAHPDVSQLHHSEVVQDPSCIIESHADEFQKRHMQRCDGFFEEHWDSTTIGSSIKVEGYNDSNWVKTEEADISFSGGKLPVLSSTEVQSTGSTLTNKCLANSLQWKSVVSQLEFTRNSRNNGTMLSDTGVTINTMLNIPKKQYAEIFSQPSHMDALSRSTCIEEPGCGSPRNLGSPISECSSPIMEHMKISFNPGNNLELSAVNLEHPVGHNLHDIIKDTFSPSFSWLPQPIVPLRELRFLSLNCGNSMDMPSFEESVTSKRADSELDSDDDSFCKPSLNFSDDMLSQDLESNSGHWESNDINGIRDDLCNGLRRISSAASVSSSIGLEETTHCSVDPDHHDPEHCSNEISSVAEVVDFSASRIQNFQTQVLDKDFWQNKRVTSVLPNSLAMQPLSPPKQLKHINSPVCSAKDQGHCLSFPVSQAKSVQTLEAVDPCQSKSGAPMSLMEPTTSHGNSRVKHIWQADERDILLEEIRAKPFNLKPAVKRRPVASSTTPTTSISVAAFLEKANAIRQAFAGSDDGGEDDE